MPNDDALIHDPHGGMPRLLAIMARLRDPETGCPWDIQQSFATIAPYTIEEAHEVADVIAREVWAGLPSELGDLLLQAVSTRRWPAIKVCSRLTMWCARSVTRWWRGIRMCSG